MTLNPLHEAEIRKQVDKPTTKMLNLWSSLCPEKIGSSVEVVACDRRNIPTMALVLTLANSTQAFLRFGRAKLFWCFY